MTGKTKRMMQQITCPVCGNTMPCEDKFSAWLRDELIQGPDGLSLADRDFVFHRFMIGRDRSVQFMLVVEAKTRCGRLSAAQRDTLGKNHLVERTHNPTRRNTSGQFLDSGGTRRRQVWDEKLQSLITLNHLGNHLLVLSGETPDDSEQIWWNNTPITSQQCRQLLQMDIHPRTFQPLTPRRHKKKKQRTLPGFE